MLTEYADLEARNPRLFVRGGCAGVLCSGKILGNSKQACPRASLLRSYGVQEPIDGRAKRTFAIGRAIETCFCEERPELQGNVRQEEMPVLGDGPFPNSKVFLAIEVDAVETTKDTAGNEVQRFYELKTVQSTKKAKQYLSQGEYSFDNAVQLAYAMVNFGASHGILRYMACFYDDFTYNKEKVKITPESYREYIVENRHDRIFVDGQPTVITYDGVCGHVEYSAWVLGTLDLKIKDILKPSSPDPESKEEHVACQWCYFNRLCAVAEQEEWTQAKFIREGIAYAQ